MPDGKENYELDAKGERRWPDCRVCERELTPEHFHPDLYPFNGEDGYS